MRKKILISAKPYPIKLTGRTGGSAYAVSFMASERAFFIAGMSVTAHSGIMVLGVGQVMVEPRLQTAVIKY